MENDALAQHLASLAREDCYRIDATLKESAYEVTQRVYFAGENGSETGPYIRKFIAEGEGLGLAYGRIRESQRDGRRFRHIPGILECYSRDGQRVVVMEYVHGDTLQEAAYRDGPSLELAMRTFPLACDAVTELHTEFDPPIIHRDLKPSNIVLTGNGLVLIDFGISREYQDGADHDTRRFGTWEFAPPEQFGFGQTGVYSDVYSLGMVLFFCLTERIPSAQDRRNRFADHRIPEDVRAVIGKACAIDPDKRYASAAELKRAFLQACSPDADPSGGRDAQGTDAPDTARRRRASGAGRKAVIAAALVLVACLAAFAIANASAQRAQEPETGDANDGADPSQTLAADASGGDPAGDEAGAPELESAVSQGMEISGPSKDGFDPLTNFSVDVAGATFQIPSYFGASTRTSADGTTYYYAETGSSTAMVMTMESAVEAGVEGESDLTALKDEYLAGILATGEAFDELVSATDCELAGLPARIAAFRGTVDGAPVLVKMAYFYNAEEGIMGSVVCGQTTNAQFDYSSDFAKIVLSAEW